MLARMLRVGNVLEYVAALLVAVALMTVGLPFWLALPLGALLPLAVHGVPLAIEFIVGALIDRRPVARIGPVALAAVWWRETWRSLVVFNLDQPWRAGFPERPLQRDPGRPAVLLVHGYMCNRATWRTWLMDGLPTEWNIATVNLEPVFASIARYAEVIHTAVEQLRAATGAERITIVCHSMGGLAARAYLRAHGHHAARRVITIDTPHLGTLFARLGRGANARQMRLASQFVQDLARSPEPLDFICFASQHDNLIVPRDHQVLPGLEAVWFERIGHLTMTGDRQVLERLVKVVERPEQEPPPAVAGAEIDR
jgi:pimeloyl-ACP methyl ester carboxylesterase